MRRDYPEGFDDAEGEDVVVKHLAGITTDHVLDMDETNRNRVFNLGYFTR